MKQVKRCPHCGGNLFLSRENGALEWACLQCARTYPAVETPEGIAVVERGREREPVTAGRRRAA
jgi:ribosomal protein L37AE/L43A